MCREPIGNICNKCGKIKATNDSKPLGELIEYYKDIKKKVIEEYNSKTYIHTGKDMRLLLVNIIQDLKGLRDL